MKTIALGLLLSFVAVLFSCRETNQSQELKLCYTTPAQMWDEAMPLGNGRLGAMPDGGVFLENVRLNDIQMRLSGMENVTDSEAFCYLPEIRELLTQGKSEQARQLMAFHFVYGGQGVDKDGAGSPDDLSRVLGNLHLNYFFRDSAENKFTDYERGLSLNRAVAWTRFKVGNVKYEREYFVSYADDVIVIKLTANKKKKLNFDVSLDRSENFSCYSNDGVVHMVGRLNNDMNGRDIRYMAQMKVILENGTQLADSAEIHVNEATTAYILVSAGTDILDNDYENTLTNVLEKVSALDFDTLKDRHIAVWEDRQLKAVKLKENVGNISWAEKPVYEGTGEISKETANI